MGYGLHAHHMQKYLVFKNDLNTKRWQSNDPINWTLAVKDLFLPLLSEKQKQQANCEELHFKRPALLLAANDFLICHEQQVCHFSIYNLFNTANQTELTIRGWLCHSPRRFISFQKKSFFVGKPPNNCIVDNGNQTHISLEVIYRKLNDYTFYIQRTTTIRRETEVTQLAQLPVSHMLVWPLLVSIEHKAHDPEITPWKIKVVQVVSLTCSITKTQC